MKTQSRKEQTQIHQEIIIWKNSIIFQQTSKCYHHPMLCYISVVSEDNHWDLFSKPEKLKTSIIWSLQVVLFKCESTVHWIFSPQTAAWTHLTLHVCQLFSMLGVDGVREQRVQVDAHLFLTIFFVLDLVVKQNTEKSLEHLFCTAHIEHKTSQQRLKYVFVVSKVNIFLYFSTKYWYMSTIFTHYQINLSIKVKVLNCRMKQTPTGSHSKLMEIMFSFWGTKH